ncbi:hypothetical protein HQ535_15125 [bacterium]|nr:hypothetical protein [bacterium]
MTRRLILHIGQHKTGSTSIQKALFGHRAQLAECGFDYFADRANHSQPMRELFEPDHFTGYRRLPPDEIAARQSTIWSGLMRQIEATDHDFIVSGEGLTLWQRDSVERLVNELAGLFDDWMVIAYVRPPRSLVGSWAQQRLKRGVTLSGIPEPTAPPAPLYRFFLEKWIELAGSERVRLRLFHPTTIHPGNPLLADFARLVGIPTDFLTGIEAPAANPSMTMSSGNVLSAVNQRLRAMGYESDSGNRLPWRISKLLAERDGPPYRLPHSVEQRIIEAHADEIRWMEDILGIEFGGLDLESSPGQNPFDASDLSPELEATIDALLTLFQADARNAIDPPEVTE